jgi:uncharacterized membrane protein|tara:strand:+ start:784 stop:1431 length:648 start_codon:yes stop_codon:yes gene_type:complete
MRTSQIIFSILLHVSLIALLEVLFYFIYVTKIEDKELKKAVSTMLTTEQKQQLIKRMISYEADNNDKPSADNKYKPSDNNVNPYSDDSVFVNNNIETFENKNSDNNNKLQYKILASKASNEKKNRNKIKNKLLKKSLIIVGVILLITIIIYIYDAKNINLKDVLTETFGSLILMGIFEYIFFTTIIIKNPTIGTSELQQSLIDSTIKQSIKQQSI